jgi:hypothetical protein
MDALGMALQMLFTLQTYSYADVTSNPRLLAFVKGFLKGNQMIPFKSAWSNRQDQ